MIPREFSSTDTTGWELRDAFWRNFYQHPNKKLAAYNRPSRNKLRGAGYTKNRTTKDGRKSSRR